LLAGAGMDARANSPIIAKENEKKPGYDVNLFTIEQRFAERCRIV
jgi:hypothetical protein